MGLCGLSSERARSLSPLWRCVTLVLILTGACAPVATSSHTPVPTLTADAAASPGQPATPSPASTAATTNAPSATASALPATPSVTAIPTVASLQAVVAAGLLSCRYGPGPDYLYLYGLREGANIVLIGRTSGDNWHWVYVQGKHPCWVNTSFIDMQGDWHSLPVVYPGIARLPVSPYYPPTSVISAVRKNDQVTIEWVDIPMRAGDEEDASMQRYIVETWRCEKGTLLFEPLATNDLSVTFTDQPGCSTPSHARIFVQEKHGFSGPTDVPWPRP